MTALDPHAARVVVLSGAGLSAASGIPTFRGPDGLWEGHRVEDVATPEAWSRDPILVRRFYDARRVAAAAATPNAAHDALARWQRAWGPARVVLITQNVDGLLTRAGCAEVIEMHGALGRLRCAHDEDHPRVPCVGAQAPDASCAVCGAPLRPDIVWFGEVPHHLDAIADAVHGCTLFLSVGTSGLVYPAAGLAQVAHRSGARTVDINPEPSGAPWFDAVVGEPAEQALPRLVDAWLGQESAR